VQGVRKQAVAVLAALVAPGLSGCRAPAARPAVDPMLAVNTLLPAPEDFAARRIEAGAYPLPRYAHFLAGVRICLDPGHGGDASRRGYKRGPTGVREAEVNLRVAKYLREFLSRAGAEVVLTRQDDCDVSYEQRAAIANDWPADLFISIHHNAVENRPQANHTTVWYHADVDYRPSNLDLARYLCEALHDMLGLPELAPVPLKSDQLMYPEGFAVLRHVQVTAALTEASFFSNPDEEQRLRDPEYNLREAYALFCGLARYAFAGLPRVRSLALGGQQLVAELDDGLRGRRSWGWERQMILSDSIVVRVDGQRVPHTFENEGYVLTAVLPEQLQPGLHTVEIQFQNMFKNSVINPVARIEVSF
jgi:N-acetylmuramoyl-L-alanine amidase